MVEALYHCRGLGEDICNGWRGCLRMTVTDTILKQLNNSECSSACESDYELCKWVETQTTNQWQCNHGRWPKANVGQKKNKGWIA